MTDRAAVVAELFAALAARDMQRARTPWSDSAVWHITGTHGLVGDYSPDEYLDLLRRWFADYPDYAVEVTDFRTHGPQGVVVHLSTRGGPAPGTASGLMIYRVHDDVIGEGWAVPTFEDGRFPF